MSLLGFKPQFAGPVERREKCQTIRAVVNGHRIGRPIQLYTGVRTKSCRKLVADDPVCVSIQPIRIITNGSMISGRITLEGRQLSPVECIDMAHADGFASYREFCQFFRVESVAVFNGFLIRWDWPA